MNELVFEYNPRLEVGDLVDFIMASKGIGRTEAEHFCPAWIWEGGTICDDDNEEWSKEVVAVLAERGLDSVEIYQDY